MTPARPRGQAAIKQLAARLGVHPEDLLVLQRENDPFFAGSKAHHRWAGWFKELWETYGFGQVANGVHTRRIHYRVIAGGDNIIVPTRNPEPYENTEKHWTYLNIASKHARALDYVPVDGFIDKRNPDPLINLHPRSIEPQPYWWWEHDSDDGACPWQLPRINTRLQTTPLDVGRVHTDGYDYDRGDQPALVEIWIEKSTMGDILEPICQQHHINLVPSVGFQSIVNATRLLERAHAFGKPVRVLWIADFDPAGAHMATAVARHVEYHHERHAPDVDLKIDHLALTADQVRRHQLPRTPIKETDRRRAGFEHRHGQGAVELDALEAVVPGELARLVLHAIKPYRDGSLPDRLAGADRQARRYASDAWNVATVDVRYQLRELETAIADTVAPYHDRLHQLAAELAADLKRYQDQLDTIWRRLEATASQLDIQLPRRPIGEISSVDESDWLYDSNRNYLDQLAVYRWHRGGAQ